MRTDDGPTRAPFQKDQPDVRSKKPVWGSLSPPAKEQSDRGSGQGLLGKVVKCVCVSLTPSHEKELCVCMCCEPTDFVGTI